MLSPLVHLALLPFFLHVSLSALWQPLTHRRLPDGQDSSALMTLVPLLSALNSAAPAAGGAALAGVSLADQGEPHDGNTALSSHPLSFLG